jgi:phage tail sheath protein FI
MATTYLAPGVYVEEVPSAQQPIAGVGTNTVGFIGIVPDQIQIPVPNEDYDEYLAQTIFLGEGTTPEQKLAFDNANKHLDALIMAAEAKAAEKTPQPDRVAKLQDDRKKAQDALKEREDQLKKPKTEAPAGDVTPGGQPVKPKKPTDAELTALLEADPERSALKVTLTQLDAELANARAESKIEKSDYLLPYRLKSVAITVPFFDTKLCTNFTEYTDRFGTYSAGHEGHRRLTHAVAGFFKNGGTRCFVSRINDEADLPKALQKFESIDEVALIAAPGLTGTNNWGLLVTHCNNMDDRFAILDCNEAVHEDAKPDELDVTLLNYSEPKSRFMPERAKNAAFYFPYIEVVDPAKQLMDRDPTQKVWINNRGKLFVPPSGHVAGVYARVDEQRGVHKSPANEQVMGATNVRYYVGKRHQELLNPQGVNCIRNINGSITVYGGRTVGGDRNSEWKYVNVRRVMLFLKESIDEGTQWVVFEPNDRALWAKIVLNVGNFLTRVWRSGALFGSTPQEAFYVKCDDETNPAEVRDVGQVVTEIGVAIVRPAEFVIFRVTQWAGPTKS